MKKFKRLFSLVLAFIAITALDSSGVKAENKYTKVDRMSNVSYLFNNDNNKHDIGDVDTLLYIDDIGNVYSTGDIDLLPNVDKSKLDTLYYKDKSGKVIKLDNVNGINYTDEKGRTYGLGTGPLNKSSTVVSSLSVTNNPEEVKKNTGWIKDGEHLIYRDNTGQQSHGWLKSGNDWYYLYYGDSGHMAQDEIVDIKGILYYFDSDGHLKDKLPDNSKQIGWVRDGYKDEREGDNYDWRYVDSNGENHKGWFQENGYWYYFETCGHMARNILRKIDGKIYSFAPDGHMEVNKHTEIYYEETPWNHTGPNEYNPLGKAMFKLNIDIDSNGICTITDPKGSDGYYAKINVSINNILSTGETHSDITASKNKDAFYHALFFDKNGDQVFGWYLKTVFDATTHSFADKWEYYDKNGVQVKSTTVVIDGKTYSFDSEGHLI